MPLAISAEIAFGLAFDVEKTDLTRSGFRPADIDLGGRKQLFGDLRLQGFAALIRLGFAPKLVLVGGNEGRYNNENINRAAAIKAMLEKDFNIPTQALVAIPSSSNTLGNIAIIREQIGRRTHRACALVSSHYHLPRAGIDVLGAGLAVPAFAAEAFLLVEGSLSKTDLVSSLGGGILAERCAEEIQGIADKLTGAYKSKTDVPVYAVRSSWWQRLRRA